jgi:hypothetical protein
MAQRDPVTHALLSARATLEIKLALADTPFEQARIERELRACKRVVDRLCAGAGQPPARAELARAADLLLVAAE